MRKGRALFALGVLLVMGGSAARAQVEKPWVLDGYGGFFIPAGSYADVVKASPGVGFGLAYYVSPAIVVGGNFNWGSICPRLFFCRHHPNLP